MEVRSLDLADVGRSLEIRSRSFGPLPAAQRPDWEKQTRESIADGRIIAVYDAGMLVARATIWPFTQWWGGRPMPMAGIAGVVVSPEYRGRGVGTALMQGTLDRAHELGYPVSALYPATVAVYRRLGWELAGSQDKVTIDTRLLRDLRGGAVPVREAGPDDAAELLALMRAHYASTRACGPKDSTEEELREELGEDSVFAYLAADGFVMYGWEGSNLVVYQVVAGSAETARALWAVVGSGSSIAARVYAYLAPDDPVHLLVRETAAPDLQQNRWMLRCVDVSSAIAGRGFALGTTVDVPVVVDDVQVETNRFTGRLQVEAGTGQLVPGPVEAGAVRLGANGFAALYAGTSISTLLGAGLVAGGDPDSYALLDAAFAGRSAFLLDYF